MNDKSYMIPLGESEIRDLLASNKAFKEANEAVKITVFNWTPQYLKACSDFKVSRTLRREKYVQADFPTDQREQTGRR